MDKLPFKDLLLSVRNLNHDEFEEIQVFVQEQLNELPSEFLPIGTNIEYIDMNYVELLKDENSSEQKISVEDIRNSIYKLDAGKLVLLEVMLMFMHHKLDFKAALPEILRRVDYQQKSPSGITSIISPALVLPDKNRPIE